MNSEKLNDWLGLLANFAVIVGIVFLIIEINQNTQAIRLSSYQELTGRIVEMNQFTIDNPTMREISRRLGLDQPACSRPDVSGVQLGEEDVNSLNNLLFIWLRHADMAYYQYETGAIPRERLLSATAPLLNILNIDAVTERWSLVKINFVPGFQAFIDDQISQFRQRCTIDGQV